MIKTVLIITLCSVVTVPAFGSSKPWGRTAFHMRGLSDACESFRKQYDVYPPQNTWSAELQATSTVVNRQRIPFVAPETALDGWGQGFVYRFPGRHNPDSFDLYSLGADGKTETDGEDPDDIANWHEPGRARQHYNPPKAITPLHAILIVGMAAAIVIIVKAQKRKRLNQV